MASTCCGRTLAALTLGLSLVATAGAQAPFTNVFNNFELPVVKGMLTFTAQGQTFVAVCNPDDNSLIVIDASTDTIAQRLAVGLGPVSVYYDAPTGRLYTANFLGDSVSVIDFDPDAVPMARVSTTQWIGDEPTDLAIRRPPQAAPELWVVLGSSSRLAHVDPTTLARVANWWGTFDITVMDPTNPAVMKYPYRLIIRDSTAYILNQAGRSNAAGALPADVELVRWDFVGTVTPVRNLLGTSHLGMALARDNTVYVVGNNARNDVAGEAALRAMPTGFVESFLWSMNDVPAPFLFARNLNAAATPATTVSMPTDVELLEDGNGVQRAFLASFSTDRVVELNRGTQAAHAIATWAPTTLRLGPRATYSLAGPRCLAIATVGARVKLYVFCRLDAAVRIVDVTTPATMSLLPTVIALPDPFPRALRAGQRLLYDALLSDNGSVPGQTFGTVSCASCHIDARTDRLAWRLDTGSETAPGAAIPPELRDGIATTNYRENRGPMVTQTLQGLRTHPVRTWGSGEIHPLLSTRPFYWRGVRQDFLAFGPAFLNLLGLALAQPNVQMPQYREFVFSIMYPPNPEQPLDRVYSGNGPSAPGGATLARRGLALFHDMSLDPAGGQNPVTAGLATGGRSCVQCHMLPSGTNGLLPEVSGDALKSSQLRGLRQREGFHVAYGGASPVGNGTMANAHGLLHAGAFSSLDSFVFSQFDPPGQSMGDLLRFAREFDTGVAPVVGYPMTVDAGVVAVWNGLPALVTTITNLGLAQVERANCDIVVDRRIGGVTTNLYWDVTQGAFVDPTLPSGSGTLWSLSGGANPVLPATFAAGDRVVFQAVPVGEGRRIGSPSGQAAVQTNTAPSSITSVAMVVADPWRDVPGLSGNLGAAFTWHNAPAPFPIHVQAMQALQNAVGAPTASSATGFLAQSPPYHEAPRRFRVVGTGLRPGAKLTLKLPTSWTAGPTPVPANWDAGTTFDLFPVRLDASTVVWETHAMIDPKTAYAMACGWFAAPGVALTWGQNPIGTSFPAGPLNPAVYNVVTFEISNENTTANPPAVPEPFTTVQTSLHFL